jgi:hypothetical protein
MPSEVNYPLLIKTLKEWIDGNKVQQSKTSILEGTAAMRTKNFSEFLFAFVSDFIGGKLPGPLNNVLGNIGTNITNALNAFGPLGTNVASGFDTVTKFFQNPVGTVMAGLETSADSIAAAAALAAADPANITIAGTLSTIANDMTDVVKTAATGLKDATNLLIGTVSGGDYSLQDVIKLSKSIDATTAGYLGLTSWNLDELAGMYVKTELHDELDAAIQGINDAVANVNPAVPATVTELNAAHARVLAAAAAIDAEVQANQENIAAAIAQDNLLQAQYDIARIYDSLSDEEKAIFGSTIDPTVLSTAQDINSYTNNPPLA